MRLETAIELAIARIERGEPGAALMGLKTARGDFDNERPGTDWVGRSGGPLGNNN